LNSGCFWAACLPVVPRQAVAARELGLTRQGLAKLMTRLRLERRASGVQPRAT
jgi:hypothetical protein